MFLLLFTMGMFGGLMAQPNEANINEQLRVYYVANPNTETRPHAVQVSSDSPIFGGNPNMAIAQQLVRAIFYGGSGHNEFRNSVNEVLTEAGEPIAFILYDDIEALREGISDTWINCIRNAHFFACATQGDGETYNRVIHFGAFQLNEGGLEASKAAFLRLFNGSTGVTGWWDELTTPASVDSLQVCVPYARSYDAFRRSVVANSPEIREGMTYRSDPEHAERVIDRRADLRDIHRGLMDNGVRDGQNVCLVGYIMRDERRWVALIRFRTRDVMNFDDDNVEGNTADVQERELRTLEENFDTLMQESLGNIGTIFGRPDSHDVSLASIISIYCNNLIRLARGERTMIPSEVSQDFARPHRDRAQRDWDNLTQNESAPALRGHDTEVIRQCRSWAREILLEHGNTTDPTTINNFVQNLNGYRNY